MVMIECTNIYLQLKPISINDYWGYVGKRVYVKRKGKQFKETIHKLLKEEKKPKILGPVCVRITFGFKGSRKRDLDNMIKPLIDCLKNVVFEDDDQIYRYQLEKRNMQDKDFIHIFIEPIPDLSYYSTL